MQIVDHGLFIEFVGVIKNTVIAGIHPREYAGAAWATERRGDISMWKSDALVEDQFQSFGHILHGIVTLVVCHDDQKIWAVVLGEQCCTASGHEHKDHDK